MALFEGCRGRLGLGSCEPDVGHQCTVLLTAMSKHSIGTYPLDWSGN